MLKKSTPDVDSTTWDLSIFAKNDNDPVLKKDTELLKRAYAMFVKKWEPRSDYLTKPKVLTQALDEYEKLMRKDAGKEGMYFWMRSQQDSLNPTVKARNNQITETLTHLGNSIQFFEMRIARISKPIQKKMLSHKSLLPYKHFLEGLFSQAKYQLSEPEEKIMNLKSRSAYTNWKNMLEEFLFSEERIVLLEKGKKKKQLFSDIVNLSSNRKKRVRDTAAKAFNNILADNVRIAEHEFNAILLDKKINDELRGYTRPDASRYIADDISPKTVDTLARVVTNDFKTARSYYKLKAQLFKKTTLDYHERNVEYGTLTTKYPYKKSVELVQKIFTQVDPTFGDIFNDLITSRRIDVFPKKGRSDGAFCIYTISTPSFVLLNHTNSLRDVMTIAHECGHALNGELMRLRENALNYGGSMATAEVASIFMEGFVFDELVANATDEEKLALMMQKLNDEISSIHRQIAGHNFQLEVHAEFRKQGYLPHTEIGRIFAKHMKSYMGPAVSQDKGSENWWVYWSHFRRYFYNFQYADGLLIAKYLQHKLKEDSTYITQIKEFLSIGSSMSFEDIFKSIGIDVTKKTFWEEGLNETSELLAETKALAKKLKKI